MTETALKRRELAHMISTEDGKIRKLMTTNGARILQISLAPGIIAWGLHSPYYNVTNSEKSISDFNSAVGFCFCAKCRQGIVIDALNNRHEKYITTWQKKYKQQRNLT